VDQGPPHKTRCTQTNRQQSGKMPPTHGQSEKLPGPMAYALRSRINKWDLIKNLQSLSKAKEFVNRTKWPPTDFDFSS